MKRLLRCMMLLLATMLVGNIHAGDVIKVCGQNLQNYFWSLNCSRTSDNGTPASNYSTAVGYTMIYPLMAKR